MQGGSKSKLLIIIIAITLSTANQKPTFIVIFGTYTLAYRRFAAGGYYMRSVIDCKMNDPTWLLLVKLDLFLIRIGIRV